MAHPAWPVDMLKELLDRVIDQTGASQAALAELISMDPSQISRWKSGKSRPSFASLERLGDAAKAAYPQLTVTTRELLAAAGYKEALAEAPGASSTRDGSDLPRIGADDWWVTTAPDDLWPGVAWTGLTLPQRWLWHTPNTTAETRYRMAAMVEWEREATAAAERYGRDLSAKADSQRGQGANGA